MADDRDGDGARHGAVGTAPTTSGTEQPRELADAIPLVERAFAFMDLCGFTKFIATNGEHAAIEALSSFRSLTRELATRRGVRVAKWLGDGAMLVGVEVGPTIAAAAELIADLCDLVGREPAERAQRQRDLRVERECRVATGEEQLEPFVRERRLIQIVHHGLLDPEQLRLLRERALAPDPVDCPVARGRRQPGARVVW